MLWKNINLEFYITVQSFCKQPEPDQTWKTGNFGVIVLYNTYLILGNIYQIYQVCVGNTLSLLSMT